MNNLNFLIFQGTTPTLELVMPLEMADDDAAVVTIRQGDNDVLEYGLNADAREDIAGTGTLVFADDGTEGTDPHDHGFDHEVDMPSDHSGEMINQSLKEQAPKPSPSRGPVFNFTPQNIASAFVLQEVLKRR